MAHVLTPMARQIVHVLPRMSVVVALVVAALLTLQGPGAALATTGPSTLEATTYRMPLGQARLYCGRYTLQQAAPAAHFTGGTMAIRLNGQGILAGLLQVYGRDAQHYATTWVATLYNFHSMTKGQMSVEILGACYSVRLGRLTLARSVNGDLSGRITLGTQSYAIQWHRLASH